MNSNLYIRELFISCKGGVNSIKFNKGMTYIHGKMNLGKSSIARLIDFTFGGDLEMTSALREVASATTHCVIGKHDVTLRRSVPSNGIEVTWTENNEGRCVLAPLSQPQSASPILGDSIYTFSDLFFYLNESDPVYVRKSKFDPSSQMIRLSIRSLLWYCYLDQEHFDSSLLNLDSETKKWSSQDALRYIMGMYSENLSRHEIAAQTAKKKIDELKASTDRIATSLDRLGYSSHKEIAAQILECEKQKGLLLTQLEAIKADYRKDTSGYDNLRLELRALDQAIEERNNILIDTRNRIEHFTQLKNEMIATKMKLGRAFASDTIWSRVRYEKCPACGQSVEPEKSHHHCYLCQQPHGKDETDYDLAQTELSERIESISTTISSRNDEAKAVRKQIERAQEKRRDVESTLASAISVRDSSYLNSTRGIEQEIAARGERLKNLNNLKKLSDDIESNTIAILQQRTLLEDAKQQIALEKRRLLTAEGNFTELGNTFIEYLQRSHSPGVSSGDKAVISIDTCYPMICPQGDIHKGWGFSSMGDLASAGSGGRKSLFKALFAIAIHSTSQRHELPLPNLLILDTPTKNVGENVNKKEIDSFFNLLYEESTASLHGTQIIVIEKEIHEPICGPVDISYLEFTDEHRLVPGYNVTGLRTSRPFRTVSP